MHVIGVVHNYLNESNWLELCGFVDKIWNKVEAKIAAIIINLQDKRGLNGKITENLASYQRQITFKSFVPDRFS